MEKYLIFTLGILVNILSYYIVDRTVYKGLISYTSDKDYAEFLSDSSLTKLLLNIAFVIFYGILAYFGNKLSLALVVVNLMKFMQSYITYKDVRKVLIYSPTTKVIEAKPRNLIDYLFFRNELNRNYTVFRLGKMRDKSLKETFEAGKKYNITYYKHTLGKYLVDLNEVQEENS